MLGSGEPLADATIQLDLQTKLDSSNPSNVDFSQKSHRFAHSDGAGRFTFESVSPGEYRLIATRSGGYVPGEYGQRTATGNGMPFIVAAGQRLSDIRLALSPTGSISGRVYDRNGEPVGRAQVQALQPVYKNGHRKLTIIQIVQTNDRGEYRLFWLPPGTYYVSARPDITELPRFMGAGNSPPVPAVRIAEPSRYSTYEQAAAPIIRKRVLKTGEVIEELQIPVYYRE
jgi:protocatechuate 3,4-dioxygenase beta subunit